MRKVALITGADEGIGMATAFKFVGKGYRGAISDRDKVGAKDVCQKNVKRCGGAMFEQCNISNPLQVASPIEFIVQEFVQLDADAKARAIGFHPLGRLGTADDVANTIVRLASGEVWFMAGHTFL